MPASVGYESEIKKQIQDILNDDYPDDMKIIDIMSLIEDYVDTLYHEVIGLENNVRWLNQELAKCEMKILRLEKPKKKKSTGRTRRS